MKSKKIGKRTDRKAQVSVFIILGIMIVVILVLIFKNRPDFNTIFTKQESPVSDIQKCIIDSSKETITKIILQGGTYEPKNYYLYDNTKVEYICYSGAYYERCVMQKPVLKTNIQEEIKKYLEPKVASCIEAIKQSYIDREYSFDYKKPNVKIEIIPSSIIIDSDLDITITKENNVYNYKNIKTGIDSELYDLVMIATSILNWEARYGDSESLYYMLSYPDLKLEKKIQSDGTRIYILTHRETKEKFMFATRSYTIPVGVTGE
ncbi:MAG: hypothetical protein Q8N99_00410 [Nanoarchaeota archaeon]|nr:hypothetical protein [Nanoarchaeota archaeon]